MRVQWVPVACVVAVIVAIVARIVEHDDTSGQLGSSP